MMIAAVVLGLLFPLIVALKIKMFGMCYKRLQPHHNPLAGFDTGARSPFRAPKSVRFHKGL